MKTVIKNKKNCRIEEIRNAWEVLQKEINKIEEEKNIAGIYTRKLQDIGAFIGCLK